MTFPVPKKPPGIAVTRRLFLGTSGMTAALALVPDLLVRAAAREPLPAVTRERAPVLAVHMNRLYLDVTGEDTPYQAPTANRTEEWQGWLDDQDYFGRFLY